MIDLLRGRIDKLIGRKQEVVHSITSIKRAIVEQKEQQRIIEESQKIIEIVAKQTQEEFKIHISKLVSYSLYSIFDNPYEFLIEFPERRGKTEAELYFARDGKKISPMISSGGGPIDIASFGLRLSLWTMKVPKLRNTFILDEPFKNLSMSLRPKAALLLNTLCRELGIQIIMISHDHNLIDSSEKVFKVSLKNLSNNLISQID